MKLLADVDGQMIVVEDLHKSYGSLKAVDGISFTVGAGEVFGILGPNGAGKTTTVEVLEGMREPDQGTVSVNGINVRDDPRGVKRLIGVQLQSSYFFYNLKLTELLDVLASSYGRSVDGRSLLRRVELEDKANSYFDKLSGGQQQRFSIAAALVNEPLVLFLDEPTTGLDPQSRRHMWELIKGFKDTGTTVLLTTHYMEEADLLCDRVAIMDGGRIIAMDSPGTLVDRLLASGFTKERVERQADLEDVFLDLTGRGLREE